MDRNFTLQANSTLRKTSLLILIILLPIRLLGQEVVNPEGSNGDFEEVNNWTAGLTPLDEGWDTNTDRDFVVNGELTSSEFFTLATRGEVNGKLTIGSKSDIEGKEINQYSYFDIYSGWGSNGNLIIKDGATVEVWGNVYNTGSINVEEGGTLIIHGNLESYNFISINGNVIVVGDIYLTNPWAWTGVVDSSDISDSANIVAGGSFSSFGGDIDSDADIYQFDEGGWAYGVDVGDEDDFIENEQDSDLYDLLEDLGFIEVTENSWLGISTSWSATGNWSTGKIPNRTNNVLIPAHPQNGDNFPVISGTYSIHSLEIEKNATVTIDAGTQFDIKGNLITNGGFIVSNESDNPASVIIDGDVEGESEIVWKSLDNSRFWYMGHPVTGQLIPNYNHSLNFEDDVKGYRIYTYDNVNFAWNKVKNAAYDFSAMEAVALKVSSEKDLSYSGELNNETDYSFNAQAEGYQTVANPYPSYIDLESMYENEEFEGFLPTVYIYASKLGVVTYDAYNAATGDYVNNGSQYISPCQSFWIHTDGDYTTNVISVSKSDCVHPGSGSLKSSSSTENKIRLCLKNSNTNDETLISFREFGQNYFTIYDSEKRMVGGKSGNLYTVKEDKSIAINSLPSISGDEIIPLGYKVAQSGMIDFTIQVNDLSAFDPTVNVYLEDLDEGITVNLREERSYSFTPRVAQTEERFQIRVSPSVTTDIIEEDAEVLNRNVEIYTIKQLAIVKVTEEVLQNMDRIIEVYDISGKLIKQVELNNIETTFSLPQTNVVYIINIKVEGDSYQQKVVTRN